jgi:ATP-dependent DNA helicase RecG
VKDEARASSDGCDGGDASAFRKIARDARQWLRQPSDEALAAIGARAGEVTGSVPLDRRSDWEKLLSGLRAGGAGVRTRVEALVRACNLFDRAARDRARLARPLSWDDPVERADGLGPAAREKLAARGVTFVADLVWTLPSAWDDLRDPVGVRGALERARASDASLAPPPRQCVRGIVKSASFVSMRGRRAVRVVLSDESGAASLDAWWFYAAHGVLALARPGARCLLLGRLVRREGKRATMAHPDLLRDEEKSRGVRARYPTLGVAPGIVRRAIQDAVARTAPLPDPVPLGIATREGMPAAEPLLRTVHGSQPAAAPDAARERLAERLAWVEAFTRVWQRILAEAQWTQGGGAPVLARNPDARARFEKSLGFALTAAQKRAIDDIESDLARPSPMRRLLLGDVGTGKTAVALAAAAQCIAAGHQCALLAPTAVLAEQYVDASEPLVRGLGVRAVRLFSGLRAAEREGALASIASGEAQLVLGTHALLEASVTFARLGLVVVDEQQRLGVAQRLKLVQKGVRARPHLLSLSATPIPRTLALALRGELATSVLDERPRGRAPVATEIRSRAAIAAVFAEIRSACSMRERVFVVCPRIEDDDDEARGVEALAAILARDAGPSRVALLHGALPLAERARAMRAFRRGDAQILVATTVVEVGVDVPEATLMVVDGAERFGLAQLHQLRGRVGRGERPGRCVLIHDEPLGEPARRRLEALARIADGAAIARVDLELRGAGDLGGTRQSGIAEDFSWLDPVAPPGWLERVDGDARALLARDPRLEAPEHRALALAVRRFAVQLAVREEAG